MYIHVLLLKFVKRFFIYLTRYTRSLTVCLWGAEYVDCIPFRGCSGYGTKLHPVLWLQFLDYEEYTITPSLPLFQSDREWLYVIYRSNRSV